MNADEFGCALVLEATASPPALVSARLATAHGASPQEFARELRERHVDILQRVPAQVFESHSHVVPFKSGGVTWALAVVQLHVHGVQGAMLVAVLLDEVGEIEAAVKRIHRRLALGTGRFLQ